MSVEIPRTGVSTLWSERKAACGVIAMVRFHTAPRRLGPIHTIQGLYVNWREPIFSRLYRKEERQKKYRQSDNLIVPMRGMLMEERGLHMRYPRKKLVQYTEIGMMRKLISRRKVLDTQSSDMISHMKSRMRESCKSGSVKRAYCKRCIYSTPYKFCPDGLDKM